MRLLFKVTVLLAVLPFMTGCRGVLPEDKPVERPPEPVDTRPAKVPDEDAVEEPRIDNLAGLRAERERLARRRRRIIFNNDGDDQGQAKEATVEGFLAVRTSPLADSQVDTICYSTCRGGFPFYSHRTEVAETLQITEWHRQRYADRGNVSVLPAFLEAGTDPLQEIINWCRENDREVFWSLRMNDTHDTAWPEEYFPEFKKQNPHLLLGSRDRRPPHGAWSALDYSLPEVRDMFFRLIEEVCRNYDIDGVELDFFRMLQYFPVVAEGGEAGDREREMMTGLLRRVRRMTEREGLRRGRPILLSARTPDSVEYCRAIGLDLETWLREGLLDIYVAGGDVRMNEWDYSVDLARRHDVTVWGDLDPVIRNRLVAGLNRNDIAVLRARALEAWLAGVDGIYMFNHFNPHHPLWRELGDPDELAGMDRLHFLEVMGFSGYHLPSRYLSGGASYYNRTRLHPDHPVTLEAGDELNVAWDLPAGVLPDGSDGAARLTAHVGVFGLKDPDLLLVELNGSPLDSPRQAADTRLEFDLPGDIFAEGSADWRFKLSERARTELFDTGDNSWSLEYYARDLPKDPWSYRAGPRTVIEGRDGALLIADRGTEPGDYLYVSAPWALALGGRAVIEARVRVVAGMNSILFGSGVVQQQLKLYPDRVAWGHEPRTSAELDASSRFRNYRVEIDGRDLRLYVDGELLLDTPGGFAHEPGWYRQNIAFGAGTSPKTGEALWSGLRARVSGAALRDLAVGVEH